MLSPVSFGDIHCQNRVVMAPMTRSRADANDCPTALHVEYYAQRASAGLIVTEGVHPSIHGKGYARTPGLHEPAQVEAWRQERRLPFPDFSPELVAEVDGKSPWPPTGSAVAAAQESGPGTDESR